MALIRSVGVGRRSLSVPSSVSGAQAESGVGRRCARPGSVVVLRHSYAPGGFDPPDARLEDCSSQRTWTRTVGRKPRESARPSKETPSPVGKVLSSPRCRCLARRGWPSARVQPWEVLQGALKRHGASAGAAWPRRNRVIDATKRRALVLVTHGSVVTDLTGLNIRMESSCAASRAGWNPRARGPVLRRVRPASPDQPDPSPIDRRKA